MTKNTKRDSIFEITAEIETYTIEMSSPDERRVVGQRREVHTFHYVSPSIELAKAVFLESNGHRKPEIKSVVTRQISATIRVEY